MRQLLSIGEEVIIGPNEEDGARGHIEAVFIYRNFVQYVVTRWTEGEKQVDTVEEFEIEAVPYAMEDPKEPVRVWIKPEEGVG